MAQRRDCELKWASGSTRVVIGANVLGDVARTCAKSLSQNPGEPRASARADLREPVTGIGTRRPPKRRALIVADANVAEPYAAAVAAGFAAAGVAARLVTVPPGDASKSINEAGRLYDAAAEAGIGRDGLIVAVGGGMVCDLAGFVGATWMRGVATAYCPTTLEADVDAAIGGKTGLNHPSGKNLIGAFHHPRIVVIDTGCLATLSERDLRAGLAESVKHALIADEPFLTWHEENVAAILRCDDTVMVELIERNVIIKAAVVAQDERETTGVREVLNFGHTIGHAIEAACQYRLRHGECVGLGMLAACRLSHAMGLLPVAIVHRVERLLRGFGLPTQLSAPQRSEPRPLGSGPTGDAVPLPGKPGGVARAVGGARSADKEKPLAGARGSYPAGVAGGDVDVDVIQSFLRSDKKSRSGRLQFVLLNGVGSTVIRSDVPDAAVREGVASLIAP